MAIETKQLRENFRNAQCNSQLRLKLGIKVLRQKCLFESANNNDDDLESEPVEIHLVVGLRLLDPAQFTTINEQPTSDK